MALFGVKRLNMAQLWRDNGAIGWTCTSTSGKTAGMKNDSAPLAKGSLNILQLVAGQPGGLTLAQISAALSAPPSRRTLQRWLAKFTAAGSLVMLGRGPAARYQVVIERTSQPQVPAAAPAPADEISLSQQGAYIKSQVTRPLAQRSLVGYERNFLNNYKANETHYLDVALRAELRELGSLDGPEQPAGTYARRVYDRLLIDLSWNSSRLEGNTYSLLETKRLIEAGELADGKAAPEAQMILNHKQAIEFLVDGAQDVRADYFTLCNIHALLSDNLMPDPETCGRVRRRSVAISGTTYKPLDVPQQLEECLRQVLITADSIVDPLEQSFFLMVHLPYLQPFEDVNKRVSRLAANLPLIKHNLCPLSFIDVPQHAYVCGILGVYELQQVDLLRDVFCWAYRRSVSRYATVRAALGQPDPFKLRHRQTFQHIVHEVVKRLLKPAACRAFISAEIQGKVPQAEEARFIAACEAELSALHDGNIARYRLRPSEFHPWLAVWRG
jgi:hypothetical protein